MDAMLISVVIPAYHSKKTIKKTISSICRELGSDILYEVIVVENGPEDGTRQVIEALARHMPYIRLYQSVQGVSNARNEGMMHASGKWLMFVDADDELHPGSGKRLIEVMQTSEADVCLFGHQSGEKRRPVCSESEFYTGSEIEAVRIRMLEAPTRYMQVWAKLFRRQQVVAAGVLFEPELSMAEDSDFTFQYTAFCRSAAFYPDIVYDYHINPVSVMHAFDAQKVEAYIRAMTVMTERMSGESEAIQCACDQYILAHFHIAMVNGVFCTGNDVFCGEKVRRIRDTAGHPVFKKAIRRVSLKSGGWISRVTGLLLKGHLYGLLGVVYTLRVWQKRKR